MAGKLLPLRVRLLEAGLRDRVLTRSWLQTAAAFEAAAVERHDLAPAQPGPIPHCESVYAPPLTAGTIQNEHFFMTECNFCETW